ncbi:hypothetical protein Ndes2526B_g02821 [Nannochloris sp. 'desiccata']|nr:putative RNA polymerase II C-terminal domain phosphatase-like 4 [Chlorella desiccata (nom. nud.)]
MADLPSPSAGGSSGDELEDLLLAELEEQAVLAAATALVENEAPVPKRQRTVGASRSGECPPHPGFMGGICIRCGVLKPPQDPSHLPGIKLNRNNDNVKNIQSSSPLALKYIHHGLEVSRDEAERLRAETVQRALASRRLLLILDLDHTLLHSSRFSDLTQAQHEALHTRAAAQTGPPENLLLYHLQYMSMWTKLRPGIRNFLTSAHELFDLHVFTMGDKDYAAGMAAVLDPNGKLFGGRVASSSDAGPGGVKDIDVLLGAEEMVMILDDTVGVWPRHKDNLMQVERYIYFPACAVRFGRGGQSLFERGEDEDADNGALATCLRVLTEVHRRFFKEHDSQQLEQQKLAVNPNTAANGDAEGVVSIHENTSHQMLSSLPDARAHLRAVRAEILVGCCILFSRIIPKDISDPSRHPFWQLATHLGAKCVSEQCPEVTHVVAANHTDKTNWAEKLGKFVVSPDWLMCCAFTWNHAEEEMFPLVDDKGTSSIVNTKGNTAVDAAKLLGGDDEADVKAALAAAGGGGR